jgi:hypothetical protein
MTTNTYGAARIGTGTKLHRAVKYAVTNFVQIVCGCPGTSNNHARVAGFFPNFLGTCARSRTMPVPPVTRCQRCGEPKPADRSCDCIDNHCQ